MRLVILGALLGLCAPFFSYAHVGDPASEDAQEVVITLSSDPTQPQDGDLVTLSALVTDTQGNPITDLDIAHDRIMHVLLLREDLTGFMHIHAEDVGPITQEQRNTATFLLPQIQLSAGVWQIAVQVTLHGEEITNIFKLEVLGAEGPVRIIKDLGRDKEFNGYGVTITPSPDPIRSGELQMIAYRFEKDGQAVHDLEPYLAAAAHFAIWSIDLNIFAHEHGVLTHETAEDHAAHEASALPSSFGPDVFLHYTFPYPGLYKIFGQFKRGEEIITTEFMVEVLFGKDAPKTAKQGSGLRPPVEIGGGFSLTGAAEGVTKEEAERLNDPIAGPELTRTVVKYVVISLLVLGTVTLFWPKPIVKEKLTVSSSLADEPGATTGDMPNKT